MDPFGRKHHLQFSPQQDDDQGNYGLRDFKRSQMDDDEDEIGKFFALMDRIRATNEILKQRRARLDPPEGSCRDAENMDVKIMTSKSPWKPSFEWEDFCFGNMLFGGHRGSSSVRDFTNNSARASKEIQNRDIRTGGSFDLNVEAPSEHPVPSGL